MSILVNTTNSTLYALQHPSSIGLWAGSAPPTLQQPAAKKHGSTSTAVALTLATMFGGTALTTHEPPPTFADTARVISPSRVAERKSSALFRYKISPSQEAFVNEYLQHHVTSRDFLREVTAIIDDIYGSKVILDIHVVEDVDTGKPIMQLTIQSGLPLDDAFEQKDQLLFQRIESSGLAWGLRDVVVTQG